jgi:hypothetical protein
MLELDPPDVREGRHGLLKCYMDRAEADKVRRNHGSI